MQNTSYQALYRSCMKEAAAQGRTLMQRLVARAADSMPRRAAGAPDELERKLLTEAARMLVKHEGALSDAYPQELLAEFASAIAGDTRKSTALSLDSLELMGEHQMQESVDLLRLQQAVLAEAEGELSELNSLLSAIQGLKTVRAERNPLRPEVYVRSLRNVLQRSPVADRIRTRWMQHLGEAMGPELARTYAELSGMLRSQGAIPARYNIAPAPETMPARLAAGGSPGEQVQASTLLNLRELRRLVSGEFGEPSPARAGPGPKPVDAAQSESVTVPAALEALQEMNKVDEVMQRLKERHGEVDGGMATQARRAGQVLAQEVVKLMVENIASDRRLLVPVQQTVRELQPALLRLAMGDPRFFSDRKHPARRLLEQMTQRSLAWESVDAPGFAAFIEPLQQAVEALTSTQIEGAEPFDFALKTLEEAWGEAQRRDRRHRENAVRALLHAEQRNLLAEKIARDLRSRPEVAGAPHEISAFLLGPWSQVIAQARLADTSGDVDPGGYDDVVGDLVWTTQPQFAASNPARLTKIGPEVLDMVRRGLAMIDYPAPAMARFIDYLSQLHAQALGPREHASRPIPLSTTMTREELEAMLGDEEGERPGSWLAPTEAQHSGFVHTDASVTPKPLFQETHPGFSETRPGAGELAAGVPESALHPGTWVEMMLEGTWARYQVTWVSPHRTLFMFANAAGKQHSMTHKLLAKMLQGGSLRLIADQTLVDGALDAVVQAALRNSLDLKL
ncbi:MAG TPA: DUF1631 family protein [Ramlibacter sp.]|nr:DUF1631 family protein [Ramlibacter sp.]